MSVEALTIAAIVDQGPQGLRKVYQAGVSSQDFSVYEEEFDWIEKRVADRKPFNVRIFRRQFRDFEFTVPDERLQDLLTDLKNERAFLDMKSFVDSLADELTVDNAIEKAQAGRDILGQVTRQHAPSSDFALIGGWQDHLEDQRRIRILRNAGVEPGIPTGLKHIDFHWDGLVDGRMIVVLGRPGEGKSFLTAKFAANASLTKYRVLFFSPEMNRREHLCRLHTLMSAYPHVKEACGLQHSFRNRALMTGIGYNLKTYKRFLEYLEGECGEIVLMTATNRRMKMSVPFIESKIADMMPDLVIVDPIYKLHAAKHRNSRIEELADISDSIQDLAEAYNIPLVVTNQAHRQMSGKENAPGKDSSFNSDVPIQEADHVIGVKNQSDEHKLLCRCTKSRFGQDFSFHSTFYPNTGVMREIGEPQGNYYNGNDENVENDELRDIVDNATKTEE